MKIISTQNAPQAIGPYSQAVVANGIVYTSGQIGLMPNGEMAGNGIHSQTNQALNNLKAVLEAAGSSMDRVIKTTIFLADMDDFAEVNSIYEKHFQGHKPARSTVAAKALPKNALVEIECIALLK